MFTQSQIFGSFEDAALGFARAAANGSALNAIRLLVSLMQNNVIGPESLKQRILKIENETELIRIAVKNNRRRLYVYRKFSYVEISPVFYFQWVCDRRKPSENESEGFTTTTVTLYSGSNTVEVKSSFEKSVQHRIAAARGEKAPLAWERATGKV